MGISTIRIKRRQLSRGFTLIEALVSTALLFLVVLMAYGLYADVSDSAIKTTSSLISLDRTRVVEDQMRYFLYHAGLGVPADAPVIIEAKEKSLSLMLNSGFYTYAAVQDSFLPVSSSTDLEVQSNAGLKSSFEERDELPLTILSDEKVALIGKDDIPPVIPKSSTTENGKLTISTQETAYWIRKGQYIGEVAQLHQFTISNGELHVKITRSDGTEVDRIIGSGIEAFDLAFFYKPTYFEDDDAPVWCADNSDADPNCRYRPGNFEEPGSRCKQSDPDWDSCVPCAGHLTVQVDPNKDGVINKEDDQNGDGKIDTLALQEVGEFKDARLMRFWILVSGDQVPIRKENQEYVVGRKVLKFNDGRKRTLAVIDIDVKNL